MNIKYLIYTDFYRFHGYYNTKKIIRNIFTKFGEESFKYIFWYRITRALINKKRNILEKFLLRVAARILKRLQCKYRIQLPTRVKIGHGFVIYHCYAITIHPNVEIGYNCSIYQGVTIGNNLYKSRDNVAKIGNNVVICAGAKIIGDIRIGNNVTIGANAVVVKDIPDNCIVAGNPAKVISRKLPIILNSDYLNEKEFSNYKIYN